MLGHHFAENWLREPPPAPRMRVFDRNGVCVGRVAEVRCGTDGAPRSIVIRPGALGLMGAAKELDCAHCRVAGDAVFTVFVLRQLPDA